eukprot:TRINITY_DN9389_c0_g2_i9.p1 TRINITY_DN9389_c0_g2~~TRINITY_DN9389_c0_g2_i9.p1  ORF type:complete len:293 (-),score=64.84 TRINITY_DN9389_c0_g2_i9:103-981(-)
MLTIKLARAESEKMELEEKYENCASKEIHLSDAEIISKERTGEIVGKMKNYITGLMSKFSVIEHEKGQLRKLYNDTLEELKIAKEAHQNEINQERYESESETSEKENVQLSKERINDLIAKLREVEIEKDEFKSKYTGKCEELKSVKMKAERLKDTFEKYTARRQEQEAKIKLLEAELARSKEKAAELSKKLREALPIEENHLLKSQYASEEANSGEETFCSDHLDRRGNEPAFVTTEDIHANMETEYGLDARLSKEQLLKSQNHKLHKEIALLRKALRNAQKKAEAKNLKY